jgi:hypothetical protein
VLAGIALTPNGAFPWRRFVVTVIASSQILRDESAIAEAIVDLAPTSKGERSSRAAAPMTARVANRS